MKKLFGNPDVSVGLLASANIGFAGAEKMASAFQPVLEASLSLAQLAVAAVTVIYIWRKAQAVRVPSLRRKRKKR